MLNISSKFDVNLIISETLIMLIIIMKLFGLVAELFSGVGLQKSTKSCFYHINHFEIQ